jgi:hypothetical protein
MAPGSPFGLSLCIIYTGEGRFLARAACSPLAAGTKRAEGH